MKDRKTRTTEIRDKWVKATKNLRKSFWERWATAGYWEDECPYTPPKRRAFGLPEEWYQDKLLDLEWLYDKRGYNEIYKEHVMAYRIINRWRSALVNPHTPLGKKKMEKDSKKWEDGIQ